MTPESVDVLQRLHGKEIAITHTTKSKAFRYLQPYQIKSAIRECRGHLFSKRHTDREFHLLTPENIVLILQEEDSKIVVVTQTNHHVNHHKSDDYNLITYNKGEIV